MIRRVRICIWRGGFFLFGFLRFCGLLSLCLLLVSFFYAVFFVPFSLDRFLSAVFFVLFSSSRFLRLASSCFILRFVFFALLFVFLVPLLVYSSRSLPPSLSLPSRNSRLANVIILFGHFRLPLSIDEPVCVSLIFSFGGSLLTRM